MNRADAESELEDLVNVCLQLLRDEGTVVVDYQPARTKQNPDFWVLTKDGQWLIECKNHDAIGEKTRYGPGRKWSRKEKRWG
jgi:hypothetical protein